LQNTHSHVGHDSCTRGKWRARMSHQTVKWRAKMSHLPCKTSDSQVTCKNELWGGCD